ncbi:MAG: GxxExxY protein [Spirochaetales bacterium]|nr:GxxExxY protein [Spirochaetales bacterium]
MDENQIGTIIVDCAAHKKWLLTYLKLTGLKLSYLLNHQWTSLSKNLRVSAPL